jgi:hypothetical protein
MYPLPQIYATAGGNAKQWQQIVLYGKLRYGHPPFISGPLTQYEACLQKGGCTGTNNTSTQAWSQMWNALNADSRTVGSMTWSTDIKWK